MSIAPNYLSLADARTILSSFPENSVQCIMGDGPYGNVLPKHEWDAQWTDADAYVHWSLQWIKEAMRALTITGTLFVFGQVGKREHAFLHLMSQACRLGTFHDLLIWDRVVGYQERSDSYTPQYEMILMLRKGEGIKFNKDVIRIPYDEATIARYLKDPRYKDKARRLQKLQQGKVSTNILRFPSLKGNVGEQVGHPTQKPLDMILQLIGASTDVGDLVVDPFVGGGTTALAAQLLGRPWICSDNEVTYLQMTLDRLVAEASVDPETIRKRFPFDQTGRPSNVGTTKGIWR